MATTANKSQGNKANERAKVFGHGVKRTQAMKIWRLWGRYLNHQWHADLFAVFCMRVYVCVFDEAARKPKGKPLIFLRCCVRNRGVRGGRVVLLRPENPLTECAQKQKEMIIFRVTDTRTHTYTHTWVT